jgi:Flp pilus assembly protein TadD
VLGDLERAAKARPNDAKAQARYGSALVEAGEASAGIARLRRAATLDPKLTAAWHNLGLAAERQGWLDVAADAYTHVVAAAPDHAGEWIKLGYVLIQLGRYPEAKRAFTRAAALQPDSSEPLVALASSDFAFFDYDGAISALKRAAAINPHSAAALADLAAIQFEHGKRAAAETAIRAALVIAPEAPQHSVFLGHLLFDSPLSEKRAEAQRVLEHAVALSQAAGTAADKAVEAEAYYYLGMLARRAGQRDQALADWQHAYALDPTQPNTLLALGQALASQGGTGAVEGRKLLAEYQRAQTLRDNERKLSLQVEAYPTDGNARLRYGKLLLAQGNLAHAVWELQMAVRLHPQDVSARHTLAEALRRQGRTTEAAALTR